MVFPPAPEDPGTTSRIQYSQIPGQPRDNSPETMISANSRFDYGPPKLTFRFRGFCCTISAICGSILGYLYFSRGAMRIRRAKCDRFLEKICLWTRLWTRRLTFSFPLSSVYPCKYIVCKYIEFLLLDYIEFPIRIRGFPPGPGGCRNTPPSEVAIFSDPGTPP